ncbi:MAG TPA: acetyl-CoA acetyltransferase [Acidimicrobiales bacterium]
MALDPRLPVVVGGGQWSNRIDRGASPVEPVDLIAEALRRAADDAGAGPDLLAGADAVWVVAMLTWRYGNPSALVAARVGATPRDTAVSPVGGNEPQALLAQACRDIAAGTRDLVLIGGAEAWRSRSTFGGGRELGWTEQSPDDVPARRTGEDVALNHTGEISRGVVMPTQIYPLFEQAYRHRLGRSVDEHLDHVARLWSRFSEVAAGNPHAWVQKAMTPEEVRTPSESNRWISWPYTKVMNANNAVDQGAGFIVTSVERARALGIPEDRWVFPWAATAAHDHYFVSHRHDLASSPAIRLAGRSLFSLVDRGVDDVAHVDLYSCFPSAVQVAADELGLPVDDPARPLTVTGGLSFAGGPWNNYVSHSIATMLGVLREDPGSLGLVTANGGYLTKHVLGLWSTEPPPSGEFRWASVQDEVDALPARGLAEDIGPSGATGTVEAWSVAHSRDNTPERAIAAVLLDDGRRAWGATEEGLDALVSGEELIGRPAKVSATGDLSL